MEAAAIAAVSARKVILPMETIGIFFDLKSSSSEEVQPPSGPMNKLQVDKSVS